MKNININEIKGVFIGHAQNFEGATGCTAILCPEGACAGADVRGGGPASRETDLLKPGSSAEAIHGVMLCGGSAYGLNAVDGALKYLEEKNIGFPTGDGVVPLVCGASIYDLSLVDSSCRPDKEMGYEACLNSEKNSPAEGNAGVGTGATVGKLFGNTNKMKGGLGIYAVQLGDVQCAAVVVVNCLGDVCDYDTGKTIAGLLNDEHTGFLSTVSEMYKEISTGRDVYNVNTTLGCIITNARLTKNQCNKLASIAHNGYAKVINPVHTSADGDTIFVLATGEVDAAPDNLGALATEVMGRAINRAVRKADSAYGLKSAGAFV